VLPPDVATLGPIKVSFEWSIGYLGSLPWVEWVAQKTEKKLGDSSPCSGSKEATES
jgi:hypothetical protein